MSTAKSWDERANHWDEQEGHPVTDWQLEVANDDTRLGYLAWVEARREADAGGAA